MPSFVIWSSARGSGVVNSDLFLHMSIREVTEGRESYSFLIEW